jgi:hypothetical protein
MCTTSSSLGRPRTTAWRAEAGRALLLAGAALLAPPGAARVAPAEDAGCISVLKQEAVLEGPGLRVRGEVTNACSYVVRNVRVQVEARDANGQALGTGEAFVDPSVLGAQDMARFEVPIAITVQPATISTVTTWRGGPGR